MNQPPISLAVSQATSAAARWFDHNRNCYTAEDEDLFDALLQLIETHLHLDALSEELERRMLAAPPDRAANPSPHRPITINPAHRGHDMTDDTTDAAHPLQGAGAF